MLWEIKGKTQDEGVGGSAFGVQNKQTTPATVRHHLDVGSRRKQLTLQV